CPPTLVKQAAATFRRILREAPPGTRKGGPYSDALTKHASQMFAVIILLSVERGLPHLPPPPRPNRGQKPGPETHKGIDPRAAGRGRVSLRGTIYGIQCGAGGRGLREPANTANRDEALRVLAQRRLEEGDSPTTKVLQAQTLATLCALVLQRYTRKRQRSLATAKGHATAWLAALPGDTPLGSLTVDILGDVIDVW